MNTTNLVVTLSTEELKDLVFDAVKDALNTQRETQEQKQNEVYLTREDTMKMLQISKVTLWKMDRQNLLESPSIIPNR